MVCWGGVGHWWRNAITERLFGALERRGFKRLRSSMGSAPQDHQRGDPVQEAVDHGIEWHELLQLLDVLLANYNAKPSKQLGGRSPLDVLRSMLSPQHANWVPRIRPPYTSTSPRAGIEIDVGRINGYVKTRVPPYVEVDEVRYSAPCLSEHYEWIGQSVYLHIPRDMRTIEAFHESGERIGDLNCLDKGWALSPHSRQVRRAINALIHASELYVPSGGDPIAAYHDYLSKKAYSTALRQPTPKVSQDASKAADLMRTTGDTIPRVADNVPRIAPSPTREIRRVPGIGLPARWK
jgi:hypothetical protein